MFTPGRDCNSCRRHYEISKKERCPCDYEECPFGKPELLATNVYPWEIYQKVASQVIVAGMGDVLGVQFSAIQFIFELYEIHDTELRLELFEKILEIDSVRTRKRSEQIVREREDAKKKKPG